MWSKCRNATWGWLDAPETVFTPVQKDNLYSKNKHAYCIIFGRLNHFSIITHSTGYGFLIRRYFWSCSNDEFAQSEALLTWLAGGHTVAALTPPLYLFTLMEVYVSSALGNHRILSSALKKMEDVTEWDYVHVHVRSLSVFHVCSQQ